MKTTLTKTAIVVLAAAFVLMDVAGAAWAGELKFNPFVTGQYLSDSNVYKFSGQVAQVTGTRETDDRIQRYTAGIDAVYAWQQQELRAVVEGRRFSFKKFKHLDHREYALDAGYAGSLLSNTTGLLNFRDERRMASFEDRRTTQLTMERDQIGRGALSIGVTPEWHLLVGAHGRNLRSPLPDAPALPQPPPGAPARKASPDFGLHEAGYNAGVQFGIEDKKNPENEAPLLLGVMMEYTTVGFSGVTPQPAAATPPPAGQPLPLPLPLPGLAPASGGTAAPETFGDYRLLTLEATAKYAVSGLSSFDGKLGATQYNPKRSSAKSRPALTGEIGVTRKFSGVTALDAHLFRRISAYVATADVATDTGVSIGANWEPILDITVLVNYAWATSTFGDTRGIAPENTGRSDKVQNATLSIGRPLFRLFGVRLFGSYSDRKSNLAYNDYTDNIVGAELSFRWGQGDAE